MMDYVLQIHLMWIFEDSALTAVFYLCMGIKMSLWEGDNGIFYCCWKDSESYFLE